MIRVESTSQMSVGQWVQLVASDSDGRTLQYLYGNMPIKGTDNMFNYKGIIRHLTPIQAILSPTLIQIGRPCPFNLSLSWPDLTVVTYVQPPLSTQVCRWRVFVGGRASAGIAASQPAGERGRPQKSEPLLSLSLFLKYTCTHFGHSLPGCCCLPTCAAERCGGPVCSVPCQQLPGPLDGGGLQLALHAVPGPLLGQEGARDQLRLWIDGEGRGLENGGNN